MASPATQRTPTGPPTPDTPPHLLEAFLLLPVAAFLFPTILPPLLTVFFLATAALFFPATAAAVRFDATAVTGFPVLLTEAVFLAELALGRRGQNTAAIIFLAFETAVAGAFAVVEPLVLPLEAFFLLAAMVAESLALTTAFLLMTTGFFFLLLATDDGVFRPAEPSLYDVLACGNSFCRPSRINGAIKATHQE